MDVANRTKDEAFALWNKRVAAPTMEAVLRDVTEWQALQFSHRTAHSIATHLLEEAQELHREPTDAEEMADVLMLLAGLAAYNNVNLVEAVRAKLAKNKVRAWGDADANGVVRHVGMRPATAAGEEDARDENHNEV